MNELHSHFHARKFPITNLDDDGLQIRILKCKKVQRETAVELQTKPKVTHLVRILLLPQKLFLFQQFLINYVVQQHNKHL